VGHADSLEGRSGSLQEVVFPPITGTRSSISDGTCVGSEETVEEIPYPPPEPVAAPPLYYDRHGQLQLSHYYAM
jgi:hypothetical protein